MRVLIMVFVALAAIPSIAACLGGCSNDVEAFGRAPHEPEPTTEPDPTPEAEETPEPTPGVYSVVKVRKGRARCYVLVNEHGLSVALSCLDNN